MVVVVFDDDEVLLGDDEILSVDLAEDVGLEHISRRTGGIEAGFEKNQPVDAGTNHVDVVCDEQHGQAQLFMEMFDQFNDIVLSRDVETGRGLIQQQHFGLLCQRPRDKNPLLLATG